MDIFVNFEQHDVQYSKRWVAENGALFAEKFLKFIQDHPARDWEFSIIGDDDYFILRAVFLQD